MEDEDPDERKRVNCSPLKTVRTRILSLSDSSGDEIEPVRKRPRIIESMFTSADRELLVMIDKQLERIERNMSIIQNKSDKKVHKCL